MKRCTKISCKILGYLNKLLISYTKGTSLFIMQGQEWPAESGRGSEKK